MTTAVFLQLFFGALLRHTYSGLAIPDFPLAYGQFFPSLDAQDVQSYNQLLIEMGYKHAADRPLMVYQIVVNLLHRYWAVVVFVTLVSGSYIFLKNSISRSIKKFGWILLSLVFIQFSLGIITVLTQKQYIVTSFHVVFGAIVLMTCALSIIHSIHSGKQKVS
jgi:heme A synthase